MLLATQLLNNAGEQDVHVRQRCREGLDRISIASLIVRSPRSSLFETLILAVCVRKTICHADTADSGVSAPPRKRGTPARRRNRGLWLSVRFGREEAAPNRRRRQYSSRSPVTGSMRSS